MTSVVLFTSRGLIVAKHDEVQSVFDSDHYVKFVTKDGKIITTNLLYIVTRENTT